MIRLHRLFPLLLAALMGVLTIWLDEITRPEPHGAGKNPNRPEYQAQGFNATRFTPNGQISQHLSAEQAWKFPNRPELFSQGTRLDVFDQGRLVYNVLGAKARYQPKTHIVVFDEQVTLFQPADAQRPATHVRTSALTVDTEAHTAASRAPVHVDYGNSTASSIGFTYNQRTGVLHLLSKAKIKYEP
jgi:lipopolysaccharide export system protein LptC